MSSIPTKQIDGDVAVGRNVSVGGKATIKGSATISHNLKVEGWLDAVNIKGPNKGLFQNATSLREAYPNPHEGWWALVGTTLPAQVYMGIGGSWVAQVDSDGNPQLGGNPTVDSTEYMEAVEELQGDIEAVKVELSNHETAYDTFKSNTENDIRNAQNTATNAGNAASSAQNTADTNTKSINTLSGRVDTIENTTIPGVRQEIADITASKGNPNGIAPLNSEGKIASTYLPTYVDDVMEFTAIVSGATVQNQVSPGSSPDDDGADVVYDDIANVFLLRVKQAIRLNAAASDSTLEVRSSTIDTGTIITKYLYLYYTSWNGVLDWGEVSATGVTPQSGKVYVCTSNNKTYRWSGTQLVAIGSDLALGYTDSTAFPGSDGKVLQTKVTSLSNRFEKLNILPVDGEWDGTGTEPTSGVWLCDNGEGGVEWKDFGSTNFYGFASEYYNSDIVANPNCVYICDDKLYCISNNHLVAFATVEELENKIEEATKPRQFINANRILDDTATYTIGEVTKLVAEKYGTAYEIPGIVFSYRGKNGWESKQWDGDGKFTDDSSWTDFGANGNNIGNTINVNDLCGDTEYTLSTAIKAVQDKETESGMTYFKSGVVLTYKTNDKDANGAPVWEAFQFTRNVADINSADLKPWVAFGDGGGSEIETSDTPAAGGKDAFSTGGAYACIPTKYKVTQEDGTVTIQPLNEADEEVGEAIVFFASQGGSSEASGTIVNIKFEESPMYGAVGKDIIGKACIRSVTSLGSTEQLNGISSLKLIDRDTNVTVKEWSVNTRSSDEDEYSFEIPFTDLFDGASSRRFRLEATDDTDHTGYRFITVTAVDATVESTQTLSYTSDYAIPYEGKKSVKIPMYKFPQNVSEKGIQAFIEILWNGEWRQLTATPPTHYDAYSNTVEFNPLNLFGGGEKMQHGAYPVRIHGKDVASGVEGNTIYTAVMCIDNTSKVPVVALRYNDTNDGTVMLYDRIKVEIAAYNPDPSVLTTNVVVKADDRIMGRYTLGSSQVETAEMQVTGYANDGSEQINIVAQAYSGDTTLAESGTVTLTVKGSTIDASLMTGDLYHFDFSGRSNNEPTHEISDDDYNVTLEGANWSSNGFVSYLGQTALRIAENVTGTLNHAPFASSTLESTGMVFQTMLATNNIADEDAMLMSCIDQDSGAGFYIKGNKVGMVCKSGSPEKIERRFPNAEMHTMAVVVEPASIVINRNGTDWATMRMYLDGELVGAIGYNPGGSRLINKNNIKFDGTSGDLYIYYMLAYQSYYDWSQAFRNYVVKLTDTDEMITEYNKEDVLVTQNAEGSTATRPSAPLMFAKGMPYCVFVCDDDVHDQFDFGKGSDDPGTSTSDKFTMTVYYYHPTMPWRSFKAVGCEIRRQGTTSAKRPKKNYRIYIKKASSVTALYPDYTNEDALLTYKLFALKKVRVTETSFPVDVITIKVDFSNSGGANDSSVCDMVNATYRALGDEYLTPAQRCFDGTWSKGEVTISDLEMNHSTANHPIAVFRANSDTLQTVWFESKGNWKEDKGEQVALGFKDTPGYNKGCLNFQDETFNWICGNQGETLDQMEARFKTMENLDTSMPYLLLPYCSRNYRFMRYTNGAWSNSTGSLVWKSGKPVITGDVLNPVGGFELLTYEGMDWWQGVSSVEDMMAPSKSIAKWVQKLIEDKPKLGVTGTEFPAWTYYFECMVDNDNLQADLAMGRIVPFELYIQLRFCDYCDYDKYPDEWLSRWQANAYKFRNVRADMVYLGDADYQNEFDSLSKNHQPMHFLLEEHDVVNGVYDPTKTGATDLDGFNCEFVLTTQPIIQQANKKYDIDGAYMSDNDGGDTGEPEADPTKPSDSATNYTNPWAGWGAIPWRAYFASSAINVDDSGNQIEFQKIVAGMRSVQTTLSDGRVINPFSPDGAKYYFISQHLDKWAKVVSSYDGIRKYIKYTATSDALYFYALQGLGLAALAQFIEQRWRFRDGYYKTGGFFSGVLSGRIACADDASIRIKAAKSGYFGMGNDSSGSLSADGAVYLEAGEEYTFTSFSHQQGALLYIYQADRIAEIEFKGVSLSENFDFSVMKLVEKIIVGGEDYVQYNIGYNALTQFALSELPFLKVLDIRNTLATSVDASKCPRLEQLLAGGSKLTTFSVAETSPISVLQLPGTVTRLDLVNLPNLTYPGGLTIESMSSVTRLMIDGCPNVDPMTLINGIVTSGNIRYIRLPNVNITAPSSILAALLKSGAIGLDSNGTAYEESGQCSGLTGRWIMEDLISDTPTTDNATNIQDLQAYFPQLTIYNAQYSCVMFDDTVDDTQNITNLDNGTTADNYVASGHFVRINAASHAYKCTYDQSDANDPKMVCELLDDSGYSNLADGTSIDLADTASMGFDIMKHIPQYWYKGVNDFKNQKKYFFASSLETEPLSTASTCRRTKLAACLRQALAAVYTTVNSTQLVAGDSYSLVYNANHNVYEVDVEGMKQVRFPGVNNSILGGVFVDADDKVVDIFNMAIGTSLFDFVLGEYLFTSVPSGAKKFVFTAPNTCSDDTEVIVVDSDAIEAIEPDWVHTNDRLVGVYGLYVDSLMRARSISGVKTRTGTGTQTTCADWEYDTDGNLTNTTVPTTVTNYTYKDLLNLCKMRGEGFQAIDYEMSKDIANLVMALVGDRDIQSRCGYGCGSQYTTGANSLNNYGNRTLLIAEYNSLGNNIGNLIFGIQNFVGCNWEIMENICANVTSWASWKKNRYLGVSSDPVNAVYHIYDPVAGTERTVQGITTSGYCIARVKFGKYADTLASRCSSDNSKWNQNYSDVYYYTGSTGRCVGRSYDSAGAGGGLVFSSASHASSGSHSNFGSRLAFIGKIEIQK